MPVSRLRERCNKPSLDEASKNNEQREAIVNLLESVLRQWKTDITEVSRAGTSTEGNKACS